MALSFLAAPFPPRTKQSHLSTITTEQGRTSVDFFTHDPHSTIAMSMRLHPGPTIHTPPYHWHKYQTETFHVTQGIFRANHEGTDTDVTAGNTISVEPGVYHTFSNGSETEDLVVETGLDPMERERDECFFRNLYGYLDDCRKANVGPSIFQIMLWLHMFDCYVALPGPRGVARWASEWLVWVLGVGIGKTLLGYKVTYPEYWVGDERLLVRAEARSEGKKGL